MYVENRGAGLTALIEHPVNSAPRISKTGCGVAQFPTVGPQNLVLAPGSTPMAQYSFPSPIVVEIVAPSLILLFGWGLGKMKLAHPLCIDLAVYLRRSSNKSSSL